jgi:signal transduction histidine kinase
MRVSAPQSPSHKTVVSLKKRVIPAITVYGDSADKALSKLFWGLIPGYDVRLVLPESREDLLKEAYNSALVFIAVDDVSDENIRLSRELAAAEGVVADIIAITKEPEIRERLHIFSHGFDNIFNRQIVEQQFFHNIFIHKLKKGIMRLNARLQEDEYRTLQGFLSISPDFYIVFDRQKRVYFVSDLYPKTYPDHAEKFVRGTPSQRVFEAISQEMNISEDNPCYAEAQNFWFSLTGQYEVCLENGRYLRMTAVPLPSGEGTIVSTTDITDYKLQEKALAEKQVLLEDALTKEQEASSLQKQFISMVSHEFRTPLSIVDGNAQILERRLESLSGEEIRRRLKAIRSAVSRTVSMMEAVLSSNLLKTGRLDLVPEHFNIKEVIAELCGEQMDISKGLVLDQDIDGLPDEVFLDRKMFILILTNLLSNAVKFGGDPPYVKVSGQTGKEEKTGKSCIFLSVEDNGVGIPENELGLIFDRFYRATTSSGRPGSGIGLSLVHDLTKLHGGNITVESTVGKGSRFVILLPVTLGESPKVS